MCAKKQYCSPEERYRHKLNMLEPGSRMLAAAGILLGVGAALYWAGWLRAAWVAFGLAGLLLALLGVLVAIELHQDRVMNELAAEEARREVSGQTSEGVWGSAKRSGASPSQRGGQRPPVNPQGTLRIRRIRELEFMVPEFVERIGGSRWVQAQPARRTNFGGGLGEREAKRSLPQPARRAAPAQ